MIEESGILKASDLKAGDKILSTTGIEYDVIGLTEKQFFTLYMEMKQEIDRINTESPQDIPYPPPPPPTRQVKSSKLIPEKVKYPEQLRIRK